MITVSLTCLTAPEEAAKWRIATVSMIVGQKNFQEDLSARVHNLATQIVETLQELVGNILGTPNQPMSVPRTRKLKTLIEQAAKLALEFQKEPSEFGLKYFPSGMQCIGSQMSDAQCGREEQELEDSGSHVIITVYPAVVRRRYGIEEEAVILKAKVLASIPPVPLEEAVA